ncbi:MAG: MerC domain-containing protein [Sphingobium sp.]|nr:MerC domain-containing protein [Sphingobium sp.]
MLTLSAFRFSRVDKLAIGLSGLCAVHCVATAVAVVLLSSVASFLAAPIIHEAGLTLAMILGAAALGDGALRHGFLIPVAVGALGLGIMAGAMTLGHGMGEMAYTILGVTLLAFGHELNRRSFW